MWKRLPVSNSAYIHYAQWRSNIQVNIRFVHKPHNIRMLFYCCFCFFIRLFAHMQQQNSPTPVNPPESSPWGAKIQTSAPCSYSLLYSIILLPWQTFWYSMGNFLDNSLNLSSEFLRSFVTFQAQTKHYQESRTRPIPGFLGWFLLMLLDKFLPGKKKLLHRFPQTTCTITSNPPAHRRSPVSSQTHNRNCSFSHDSFTITILTSSTVVQSSHTSQYGYKQLIQLLSFCAVWKFVSSILLQHVSE